VSVLFPEGVTSVADLPYNLFEAIRLALIFVKFEEMPKEERPPKRIWLDAEKLEAHMKWVEKQRDAKYSVDKDGQTKEIEDPVQNDAASMLIVGDE
jgi:hypothetical protein